MLGAGLLFHSLPARAQRRYSAMNLVAQELAWEREWVRAQAPARCLVLTNKSTLPWVLAHISSMEIPTDEKGWARVADLQRRGLFTHILVTQSLQPTSITGDLGVVARDRTPSGMPFRTLSVAQFGGRVSRVVLLGPPAP